MKSLNFIFKQSLNSDLPVSDRAYQKLQTVFKVMSYSLVYVCLTTLVGKPAMALDRKFNKDFPYMAADADIQKAMSDMGRHAGFAVRVDPAVQGNVTVDNAAGSIETFLNEAMTQTRAVWWYDGVILYVEPKDGLSSTLMVSQGLSVSALLTEMEALDLCDDRFPITATGDGAVIRIVGPQGYIKQIQDLADTLINSRRARTGTPEEAGLYIPRVYHGRALQ